MPSEAANRIYTVATRLFGDRSYPSTSMRERAEYGDYFRRIVDESVRAGEYRIKQPRIAALGIVGLLNWVPEWFSAKGPLSAAEAADALTDLALSGLEGGAA